MNFLHGENIKTDIGQHFISLIKIELSEKLTFEKVEKIKK